MSKFLQFSQEGVMKFSKGDGKPLYNSILEITNTHDQNVAYKIQTTTPKKFMVKPSAGIVAPNRTIIVEIQIASDAIEDMESLLKNRFLVMGTPTELQSSENYKLTKFWQDSDAQKDKKKQQAIFKIDVESQDSSSAPRETVVAAVKSDIKEVK